MAHPLSLWSKFSTAFYQASKPLSCLKPKSFSPFQTMPDSAFSNAIIDDAILNAKSNVFNVEKNNISKNISKKSPTIELVDSETLKSNNYTENKNLTANNNHKSQHQQQQFRSKKNVIEELQNNNKQHFVTTEPIETNTEEDDHYTEEIEIEMSKTQGSLNSNMANKLPTTKEEPVAEEKSAPKAPRLITSRIVFLKVGQIDTRNERYDAEAYLECSWEDDEIFKVLSDPTMGNKPTDNKFGQNDSFKTPANLNQNQNNMVNLKNILNNISCLEYDPNLYWSPQLYCENAIGDLKEEIRHKLEIVEKYSPPEIKTIKSTKSLNTANTNTSNTAGNLTVKVSEMRKVRGVFYERLELYDFPMDIQEISITITSKRSIDEVQFVENKKDASSINTEDFLDQQEWDLFDFVECANKTIYDPWRKYDRSAFSVKSFISRKPGYYLYNAYMLIFLITVLGFVPFAFEPSGPQFRCQVTGLLLLTSVNFRWIVTQRLPSVPYLTSLDKYAIGSLLYLVLFCVWHSIIGSTIISPELQVKRKIDGIVLYCAAGIYIFFNFCYLIWFFKMARANSNSLVEGRNEYKRLLDERAKEFEEMEKKKEEALLQQQQLPMQKNSMPKTPNMQTRNQSIAMNNINRQNQMSLKQNTKPILSAQQGINKSSTNQTTGATNETAFLMA